MTIASEERHYILSGRAAYDRFRRAAAVLDMSLVVPDVEHCRQAVMRSPSLGLFGSDVVAEQVRAWTIREQVAHGAGR